MGFKLESRRKKDEVKETPEKPVESESRSKTEKSSENYDDCALTEVKDSPKAGKSKALETEEDTFEDCDAKLESKEKTEKKTDSDPETDEEDFSDCGKDSESGEADSVKDKKAEVQKVPETVEQDPEDDRKNDAEELAEDGSEEATENDPGETSEIATEDGTEVPTEDGTEVPAEDGTEVPVEDGNEVPAEDGNEVPAEDGNEVPAEDGTEVPTEDGTEVPTEDGTEVPTEDGAEIPAGDSTDSSSEGNAEVPAEDKTVVPAEDSIEVLSEDTGANHTEITEDTAPKDSEDGEETSENITDGSVNKQTLETEADTITDEAVREDIKAEEVPVEDTRLPEDLEAKTDEVPGEGTEIPEEMPVKEETLEERVRNALENEEATASELSRLRYEHAAGLRDMKELQQNTQQEAAEKFSAILEHEKGTEAYKEALQEYNSAMKRKEELGDQIRQMEVQQEKLSRKTDELQEVLIARGNEAAADSVQTLAGADELQNRFDEAILEKKPDRKALDAIRQENAEAVEQLDSQKETIRQAMDAKMDRIRDYVASNNMDRYDTDRDPHYQRMIGEYRQMETSLRQVEYAAVKLGENNREIEERLGEKRKVEVAERKFGRYDVDDRGFVKGENHDKFIRDWEGYDADRYHTEMYDEPKIQTISPSLVEGIRVSDRDVEDPSIFWSQHESGGTEESFCRIAENIPEVRSRLEAGESLSDLMQDPKVGSCAAIYFHPSNIPEVIKCGDYYEFQSNGRHRILAARDLGYDIPVKVVGERTIDAPDQPDIPDVQPEKRGFFDRFFNRKETREETADLSNLEKPAEGDIAPEIGRETRENLKTFRQSDWEKLSQPEKEQAVENLRDSIAEDLGIENKPNIAYYYMEKPGDYGGYAASTNTIYINRFNLNNAAEAADTIAHESRHCWQHERAANPRTAEDYRLRENFENYVRPELNFEEYYAQPVEQDARDYAAQVKKRIPGEEASGVFLKIKDVPEQTAFGVEKVRGPPGEASFSKAVTELPEDFEAKNEAEEIIRKTAQSIHGAEDFQRCMSETYGNTGMTPEEKVAQGLELYNAIPEGQRRDINVIDNPKALRTDSESIQKGIEEGRLIIAFSDHHGLDETKPICGIGEGKELPRILCRVGPESGNNLSQLHADGSLPDMDELSVPYARNPEAVHIYETDAVAYKEAIDIIADGNSTLAEKTQKLNHLVEKMNEKYGLNNPAITQKRTKRYVRYYNAFMTGEDTKQCRKAGNCEAVYGVCGTVAPMYMDDDPKKEKLYSGGAAQFNTPCRTETFTALGVFREVNRRKGGKP